MSLHIFGIPHKRTLLEQVVNNICYVPIMHSAKPVAFGMAEKYKDEICLVSWYTCREVFHDNYPTSNHLFVLHENGQGKVLKKFIHDIENRFGIFNHTEVFNTYRKNCSLILLNQFWKKKLQFSLFTLLVRHCLKYNRTKFSLEDIAKCDFLKDTKPALSLMLNGKMCYCGRKSSWYDQFKGLNLEQSAKYLR
jgi:hypothetical protein